MRQYESKYIVEVTGKSCPVFVALAGDDFLDADDDLDSLIEQLVSDKADQDVVIWDTFDNVAAVVLCDGTVHRFDGPRSAPKRQRNKA